MISKLIHEYTHTLWSQRMFSRKPGSVTFAQAVFQTSTFGSEPISHPHNSHFNKTELLKL